MIDAGFLYDSSLMASDDGYGSTSTADRPGGLPIERIVDDAPYFGAADGSMRRRSTCSRCSSRSSTWPGRSAGSTCSDHPHYTGHRSRVAMLDRLIRHMKAKGGVWFATREDVARHLKGC
ncbi:MAG: hypothetical protein R2708_27900 [Vicinamibacterales bacterium]